MNLAIRSCVNARGGVAFRQWNMCGEQDVVDSGSLLRLLIEGRKAR